MAAGILQQDRRTVRAAGIVERQECELQDDGRWLVRDAVTGSGEWHTTTAQACDCWDFRRRGGTCKHMRAVLVEERALRSYAAGWDTSAEVAKRASGPHCPDCDARLVSQTFYIGGKGYQLFMVCTRDAAHRALPA